MQTLRAGVDSVSSALIQGLPLPEVLTLIASCAQRTTAARLVLITTTTAQGDVRVEATAGVGASRLTGSQGRPDPGSRWAADPLPAVLPGTKERGRALDLPLGRDRSGQPRVMVLIADRRGALEHDEPALAAFARQIATSLTLAQQRERAGQDAALLERDALAGALLDQLLLPLHQVITELASADGLIDDQPAAARARIGGGVDALEQIISRTRRVICGQPPPPARSPFGG